ncbi:NPCBM/NEW2 domain-containing protein [Candidatus Nephthysia bennettiae]|uniref:NPCBM/NEW2 domain-containing protein n=1 Tax=Candidatus Nephthysia bennettiae TaxID=3127016 RepID=A0A934K174_9BACT|nr:NPCBM/NEW2 domain-containing protein [Candidatus Dormibacteraeota bacterium]MBJ7614271.1 NPCBM/NEW2 domain-containing protein [Candidatus Dormibacteraeota bacterium]
MTAGDPPSSKGLAILGGHQMDNSLSYAFGQSCCGGEATETVYDLGGKFHTFESMIGLEDQSTFDVRFKVVSNDMVVYDKTVAPGETVPVKADVTGANTLHLQMTTIDPGGLPLIKRATAIWGSAIVS